MKRLGIVTAYPKQDWHSQSLYVAAQKRAEVEILDPLDLSVALLSHEIFLARGRPVTRFDALILARALDKRGGADFQLEFYRGAAELGVWVLNAVDALLQVEDKFRTSLLLWRAGLPTPATWVAQTWEQAELALQALEDVVIKPLYGSLGLGIERLMDTRKGRARLKQRLSEEGALYLQRYVESERDLRLFVVGNQVLAQVERTCAKGDFRSN